MKMFMKKKYSSFLFTIMMLSVYAPITIQAQYRSLSGRAAKFALQHGIKHQTELEDLKTIIERKDEAVIEHQDVINLLHINE